MRLLPASTPSACIAIVPHINSCGAYYINLVESK